MPKTTKKEPAKKIIEYDMDKIYLHGSSPSPKNELDNILKKKAAMLASKAETLQLQSYVDELEKQVGSSNQGATMAEDILKNPQLLEVWKTLDQSEKMALNAMMQNPKGNTNSALLPLLLMGGIGKKSEGMTFKDSLELAKLLQNQGQQSGLSIQDITALMQLAMSMSQGSSPAQSIKEVLEIANTLGLSSGNIDGATRLKLAQMKQEADSEEKKWEMIGGTIKQALGGPLGAVAKSLGDAGAERIRHPASNPVQSQPQQPMVQIQCPNPECKMVFTAVPAASITCPGCGGTLIPEGSQPAPESLSQGAAQSELEGPTEQ